MLWGFFSLEETRPHFIRTSHLPRPRRSETPGGGGEEEQIHETRATLGETSTPGPPPTFMGGTLLKGFSVWLVQNSADISFSEKLSWTWLTVFVLLL